MKVLVDTCVLAELRHPKGSPVVKSAFGLIPDDNLYTSALVVGEIAGAIRLVSDRRKKQALNSWLTILRSQFADRILPIDDETACLWGDISVRSRQAGLVVSVIDGLLAASALRHGLHVMTRHPTPIGATGALTIDPWNEP